MVRLKLVVNPPPLRPSTKRWQQGARIPISAAPHKRQLCTCIAKNDTACSSSLQPLIPQVFLTVPLLCGSNLQHMATPRYTTPYLQQLLEKMEGHEGVEVESDDGAKSLVFHVHHRVVDRHVRPHLHTNKNYT